MAIALRSHRRKKNRFYTRKKSGMLGRRSPDDWGSLATGVLSPFALGELLRNGALNGEGGRTRGDFLAWALLCLLSGSVSVLCLCWVFAALVVLFAGRDLRRLFETGP